MEIYNKEKDNYISVWMTREEQQLFDRQVLTDLLLSTVRNKKCKVVYFLSGNGNQYTNTENLLVRKYGVTSGTYFFINRYIPHQNANTNFDQICIKGEISHAQGRNSQKDRRPVRN